MRGAGAADRHALDASDAQAGEHRALPVTLVRFPPVWGRNISPFALKLEAWLKLADIPFEVELSNNLAKAPKGKLPYIVDGRRRVGDSTLIIDYLKHTRGIDPDAGLSRRDLAESLALQRLFEEHLYFILVYSRWIDEEGWAPMSEAFFGLVPAPVRAVTRTMARERVRKILHFQGIGRHDRDEVYHLARADLAAVAELLGDRPFFLGDRITTLDAIAYGCLANILLVPLETELKRIALEWPSLTSWCEAMEHGLNDEG